MAVIETWLHQDLQEPVKVNHLDGNLFSNNGNGNRIGVVLTNNGEALASISGTVSGYVVTADGSTVPCTGSKSGNRASILIPAAAYQPGSIFITVFVTDGTTVTTIGAVSTTVMRSRTNAQVDPGSAVTDWTQTINAAMQSVETAAANLGGIVAVPYASITFPVPLGKYTYYNNNLYRCISPIASSESFTAAHWTQVRLGDEVSDLKSAVGNIDDTIIGKADNKIDLYIKGSNEYGVYWSYQGVKTPGTGKVCVTDYMPVAPGSRCVYGGLTSVGSAPHTLYFNSSKQFVGGFKQKTGQNNIITIPNNAYFISFSIIGDDDETFSFVSSINLATKKELQNVVDDWQEAFENGKIYKNVEWEYGGFTNNDENNDSPTTPTIRTVNDIDFSKYTSVSIEMDEGYKIIRLDKTGTAPYDMTQWITEGYTFGIASDTLYRFGVQKTDGSSITAEDASHIRFNVAEIHVPGIDEIKADLHQVIDREPTYVILDFDADISSLTDKRVTLVHDSYGYNFTFVGISNPEVTKALIKMGCDLSIYSNKAGYLPNTSTINSDDPADIAAWDAYVKEVLDRYNAAGFFNQVCWSCQGMNYGSALETALKKYGFKMARGNQVGGTSSICIDGFDDSSYLVGCYQIYSDHPGIAIQQVTNAINDKKDICIFTHQIVDTLEHDYDCTTEAYTTFLEGIKTMEENGLIKVVSFREYYKMHCFKQNYEYDYNRIFKTMWNETN